MGAAVTEAACRGAKWGIEHVRGHSPSQNRHVNLASLKKLLWVTFRMFHCNSCPPAALSPAQEADKQQGPLSWVAGGSGNSSRPRGVFIQSVSLPPFPWYINCFRSFPAVSGDKWWQWEPIFNLHCSGCTLCGCHLLSARLSGRGFSHLPAAPPLLLLPCTWKAQPPVPVSFRAQPPSSAFMDAPQAASHREFPETPPARPWHSLAPSYLLRWGLPLAFVVSLFSSSSSRGDLSGFTLSQWMMDRGGLGK